MGKEAELQAAIDRVAKQNLKDEIEHFQTLGEEVVPLAVAFNDVVNFAEQHRDRSLLNQIKKIEIELGLYRPVSDEEYARTEVHGGNKNSLYTMINGQRHIREMTYSDFEAQYS